MRTGRNRLVPRPSLPFIGTNYYVAMMARPRKIRGERVVQLYLATGPMMKTPP